MRTQSVHTLAALAAVVAAGCACGSAQAQPDQAQIRPGEETGLGITGPEIPDLLKKIQAEPYVAPAGPVCEAAPAELSELDRILGPDADEAKAEKSSVNGGELAGKAVRMLIPHRGLIRMVTGADRKEKELTQAAMAASARRGYLKGLMRQAHCGEPIEGALQTVAAEGAGPVDSKLQIAASAPLAIPPAAPEMSYGETTYAPSYASSWQTSTDTAYTTAGSTGPVSVSLSGDVYGSAR